MERQCILQLQFRVKGAGKYVDKTEGHFRLWKTRILYSAPTRQA